MMNAFDKIAEDRIQEAMRNGEFDNLPQQGKPINLDYWASLPPEQRAGFMLLRNAGYVPEEVLLLKEIAELREKLAACNNQDEKTTWIKKLEETKLKYNLIMESRRRKR